jgi:RsiW-degrading membrane proteinase PrsW (M82 family)
MRYLFLLGLLFLSGACLVTTVYAAGGDLDGTVFTKGITKAQELATGAGLSDKTDLIPIITGVIQWLLALSAVLAMGAIVWGGIMYIMSLGDEGRAGKAKQIIFYAIIGIIVILMSFVIISFIQARLTASVPWGVSTVYAADTVTTFGFKSGIDAITSLIKPKESGLATGTDIVPIIISVINLLLGLVAVLALAALVWASIMYILSLGDESRAEKAKKIILYAIIGVLLSGLSFLILNVVKGIIAP